MTPHLESAYGKAWAAMAASEGHKPRAPIVQTEAEKREHIKLKQGTITQAIIKRLREVGPCTSGEAAQEMKVTRQTTATACTRMYKNGQIKRYKCLAKQRWIYYV